MADKPVIAIFDVGKTNKKLFLFDEDYQIVFEKLARFTETTDEAGDVCENLESLRSGVWDTLREVGRLTTFDIKAINFSTYGASFVYLGEDKKPLTPLYNYLKAYPEALQKQLYNRYGGAASFSRVTASPVLGSLNSGMQLYRIKYERPWLFEKIKFALHLPQYMSFLISGEVCTDITSIGCHTHLWNFDENNYHQWVSEEGLIGKLPPIVSGESVMNATIEHKKIWCGTGLHDSSAALIPYLMSFQEPFLLLSTGTWCISLNPFNSIPLSVEELEADCLCYLSFKGTPVKASRLFAGFEHEQEVKRIADFFQQDAVKYKNIPFDRALLKCTDSEILEQTSANAPVPAAFSLQNLAAYNTYEEAYHHLIWNLVIRQFHSTQMVIKGTEVKRIFVDGGFSKNNLYMNLLAKVFPSMEIYAASMAQATALGTALAIHSCWNRKDLPSDIISLKRFVSIQ